MSPWHGEINEATRRHDALLVWRRDIEATLALMLKACVQSCPTKGARADLEAATEALKRAKKARL